MIRKTEIYIQPKTRQRLKWIAALENDAAGGPHNLITRDEVADRLLNERIEELYPNIAKLEKRFKALEDQMIVELAQNFKKNEAKSE